jgi:formylglycine-generating enzyme required for sulfatase activity
MSDQSVRTGDPANIPLPCAGMRWIGSGMFRVGDVNSYPEARTGAALKAADSNIEGLEREPVVHLPFEDAAAPGPARGCLPRRNGSTPRAADWTERGSAGANSSCPVGATWRTPGRADFRAWTVSPAESFPPNGYGLYNMAGLRANQPVGRPRR